MSVTDVVLVTSHIYLIIDLAIDWDSFRGCKRPVHNWLMLSYALMMLSRMAYLVGQRHMLANTGDFLLNARQKNGTSKFFFRLMWYFIVPGSTLWNIVGSIWLYEVRIHSPQCLPISSNHLWIMIIWQALGYAWVGVHCKIGNAAWVLEKRVRAAEDDLHLVADADALSRWGSAAEQVQDYTALRRSREALGLSPAEICALGSDEPELSSTEIGLECAICLEAVDAGDSKRRLAACEHVFHRACIDLWLLRCASCPLCKASIKASEVVTKAAHEVLSPPLQARGEEGSSTMVSPIQTVEGTARLRYSAGLMA